VRSLSRILVLAALGLALCSQSALANQRYYGTPVFVVPRPDGSINYATLQRQAQLNMTIPFFTNSVVRGRSAVVGAPPAGYAYETLPCAISVEVACTVDISLQLVRHPETSTLGAPVTPTILSHAVSPASSIVARNPRQHF